MEDLHVQHLTDAQMKELNLLIRQALLNIVSILETDESDADRNGIIGYLISQIPSYWEIPEDEDWR